MGARHMASHPKMLLLPSGKTNARYLALIAAWAPKTFSISCPKQPGFFLANSWHRPMPEDPALFTVSLYIHQKQNILGALPVWPVRRAQILSVAAAAAALGILVQ